MNTQKLIYPLFVVAISFLAGCVGEWQNPNNSVAAQELKIRNLLIFPIMYDSAGVILEGKIWDLDLIDDKDNTDQVYSKFKLADKDGNYVYVTSADTSTLLQEGEMVKVIGIHRLLHDRDVNEIANLIEAKKIVP